MYLKNGRSILPGGWKTRTRATISNEKAKRPAATSNEKGSYEKDKRHRATISNENESNEKVKRPAATSNEKNPNNAATVKDKRHRAMRSATKREQEQQSATRTRKENEE